MNKSEFNSWWQDFKNRFPERVHWLTNKKTGGEQGEIITTWFQTLSGCELADALSASAAMQSGDLDYPEHTDMVPAAIRKFARQAAYAREQRDAVPSWRDTEPQRRPRVDGIVGLCEALKKMHEDGVSEAAQMEFLNEKFPASTDGPRYHCRTCLDSGWVTIWAVKVLNAIRDERDFPKSGRSEVCRCSCRMGRPRGKLRSDVTDGYKGPVEDVPMYDPSCMLIVKNNDTWSDEAIERAKEFVAIVKEAYWNSKRNSVLDAYNSAPACP